ncbi:MAG: imidazolonepropionase [Anaerolineae bacterium]|nr:imidazolonepropionase [Anaerolineae bacterium]MDW8102825.1 imidazolonepropionase [Anaerolineae bacterium]
MPKVDLIIFASQIATPSCPGPARRENLGKILVVQDGAIAIDDGLIADLGPRSEITGKYSARETLDFHGCTATPGMVDPHTHLVFAGDRVEEFELRLKGATYLEIMAAGGGIMSTVRKTREAPFETLLEEAHRRTLAFLSSGTTTVEIKTGYGLETRTELKMMEVIMALKEQSPLDIIPTFLGAHAVPAEFWGRAEEYVTLVTEEMLPALARWADDREIEREKIFCDVFCDEGAFTLEQSARVLRKARELGFSLKIHSDEFKSLGATGLAVELEATSADHLAVTPEEEALRLASSSTIGVILPGTSFGLGHTHFADGKGLIEKGVALALGTDFNPGTCWCESMPFMMALACRYCGLSPSQALTASTLNAAWALKMGEKIGSLEKGKQADIALWEVPDYRHLAYRFGNLRAKAVIKRGKMVYPDYPGNIRGPAHT